MSSADMVLHLTKCEDMELHLQAWGFFKSTPRRFCFGFLAFTLANSAMAARSPSHLTVDNYAIAKITYTESHSCSRQTESIHKSIINTLPLFLQP